jgi:hypothetical protein
VGGIVANVYCFLDPSLPLGPGRECTEGRGAVDGWPGAEEGDEAWALSEAGLSFRIPFAPRRLERPAIGEPGALNTEPLLKWNQDPLQQLLLEGAGEEDGRVVVSPSARYRTRCQR